jgi:mannose-6-phosphate isomerase-like protein (cupin superfamily)
VKPCAIGGAIGGIPLAIILAMGACHSTPTPANIPPVTTAHPNGDVPIASDGPKDASAGSALVDAAGDAYLSAADAPETWKPKAAFHDTPYRIEDGACERVLVAVAKGSFTIANEKLEPGDVIAFMHPEPTEVKTAGQGLVLEARIPIRSCVVKTRPAPEKTVIRAKTAPKLEWAGGKMSARLDVGPKVSPDLYLGRLEGTGGVAEHVHAGSWEVLAAIDAAGTFTLDGKDQRLGARQVVFVPPNTKHSWRPDAGSKLVALQMYSPPGPEQRFIALAAAEKDAGKP